jgi:hypothetical protein
MGALAGARARRLFAARAAAARLDPVLLAAFAAAVGARIFFWAYTDRRFEDGLITITHAANAAHGLGLTHHPGEGHVHGFTSALSVLVPLAGEFVHHGAGMTTMRLASVVAAAATIYFADRLARRLELGVAARIFLLGYLALDYLQLFYGMAGMETQIAVAVLFFGATMIDERRVAAAGLALGLALLARPDFVLWVAPALAWLLLRDRTRGIRIAAIAAAIVIPWLVFTTAYYGSPVPHTIVAKSTAYEYTPWGESVDTWWGWLRGHVTDTRTAYASAFTPLKEIYFANVGTFAQVPGVIAVLAAAGLWWRRRAPALVPIVAFAILFTAYLVATDPPGYFRWYLPPSLAAIALVAACGIDWIAQRRRAPAIVASVALVAAFAIQLPVFFPLDRTIQHRIEDRVREPLGKYLHEVVRPGESVMAEPAGYIGYYGHVKLYDFPGLTSPTVSDEMKRLPRSKRSLGELVRRLRPDWLVLRPSEAESVANAHPRAFRQYRRVKTIRVSEASSRLSSFGVDIGDSDREFRVYRRSTSAA